MLKLKKHEMWKSDFNEQGIVSVDSKIEKKQWGQKKESSLPEIMLAQIVSGQLRLFRVGSSEKWEKMIPHFKINPDAKVP